MGTDDRRTEGGTVGAADLAVDETLDRAAVRPEAAASSAAYVVDGEIARGGLGRILRARDQALGRTVAIKELLPGSTSPRARLLREARITGRLEHPGIVPVYSAGSWPGGEPFYSMKLVSGRSLSEIIAATGSLSERLALLPHALAVADALGFAHSRGVIHRDIKPANIVVGEFGETLVVDWGLAKDLRGEVEDEVAAPSSGSALQTAIGAVVGTPAYMAPEQAAGRSADERADVYALGALLYELLSGVHPRRPARPGDGVGTRGEIVAEAASRPPIPLDRRQPGVPADLLAIVHKAMAWDPAARYPTAKELAEDLRRFATGQLVGAHRYGWLGLIRHWVSRHRALTVVTVAALVALAGAGLLLLRAEGRSRERSRLAQRFADEARATESIMRFAHLLPLHDIRGDQARVRRQMARLTEEMSRLGGPAQGPGQYALGRGALALGRFDEARQHLERAWAAGTRGPDVAYALGQALGGAYRRALDDVAAIQRRELRQARRAQIERELREPALGYLRASQGSMVDAPAYVEGTIALYEGRYAEALARAREAGAAVPWLYEARRLEGDTHTLMLVEARERGDPAAALASAASARASYRAASEIARSDAAIFLAECHLEIEALVVDLERGDVDPARFAGAAAPCERALAVDPDDPRAYRLGAEIARHEADVLALKGTDPAAVVERSVKLADEALRRNPEDHAALVAKGVVYSVLANDYQLRHDVDPRPALAAAIESFERAIALRADAEYLMEAGTAYAALTSYQRDRGLEWETSFARAIDRYQSAIGLNAGLVSAHNDLGTVYEERGVHELAHGKDPGPSMQLAIACFDKAVALKPTFSHSHGNRAGALSNFAEYELLIGRDPSSWIAQAIAGYEKAIELRPSYPYTYDNLARVLWLRARWLEEHGDPAGDIARGLEVLIAERKYATDDPYNPRFAARLSLVAATTARRAGNVAQAAKRIDEARDFIRKAVALSSEAEALAIAAEVEWRAAQLDAAHAGPALEAGLALAERAVTANKTLSDGYAVRAVLKAARARGAGPAALLGEARADLAKALELNPLLDRSYRDGVEKE